MAVLAQTATLMADPLYSMQISGLPTVNNNTNLTTLYASIPTYGRVTQYGVGLATITGTVLNSSSIPVARTVIAYERTTNVPLDVVVSNSITGVFTLYVPVNTVCYVVCLPSPLDGTNAEIYDNITPINP